MLAVELLEARDTPAVFTGVGYADGFVPIPGWTGPVEVTSVGDLDVFVAGEGGSCRVVGRNVFTGETAFNAILFDPAFRGGGHVAASGDKVAVTPGAGGGPVVTVLDLSGKEPVVSDHFLPYDQAFRGGVNVNAGDVGGDGRAEFVFTPLAGGGPLLAALDRDTGETVASFLIGPEDDRSGKFQPVGASIGPDIAPGVPGLLVQYGDDPSTTRAVGFDGTFYS